MKCRQYKNQLALYVHGDLPEEEIPGLQLHLKSCPDCTAELNSLKQAQRAIQSIVQNDSPDLFPENMPLIIQRTVSVKEAQESTRTGMQLEWLWRKPMPVVYGLIAAFILGAGVSWQYFNTQYHSNAPKEILTVIEMIQEDAGQELSYQIIQGSSLNDLTELPPQPGIHFIMHRSTSPESEHALTIAYYGDNNYLPYYKRYPWYQQRKKKLIQEAGSLSNIYIILFHIPEINQADHKSLDETILTHFRSSFVKGI